MAETIIKHNISIKDILYCPFCGEAKMGHHDRAFMSKEDPKKWLFYYCLKCGCDWSIAEIIEYMNKNQLWEEEPQKTEEIIHPKQLNLGL